MLGRHHVLDVVFGALLGISYVYLWEPFWISPEFAGGLHDIFHGGVSNVGEVSKAVGTVISTMRISNS